VTTSFVTSDNALKTEEFSLLEPGVLDNKYYVKGIGNVAERTVQGGSDTLDLVSVAHWGRDAKGRRRGARRPYIQICSILRYSRVAS